MAWRFQIAWAGLLTLVAGPAEASQIGVVVLLSDDAPVPISEIYRAARGVLERETTLEITPLDLFSKSLARDVLKTCAGDGRCFLTRFREAHPNIELLLTISVASLVDSNILGLRLVDARRSPIEEFGGGGPLAPGTALSEALGGQLETLMPSDIWGQVSFIETITRPSGAEVRLDALRCVSPCRFDRLPPGTYTVEVEKEGFLPWRGVVDAKPRVGGRAVADLEPTPAPTLISNPWFWTAVGAVVIGAGVLGVALATGPDELDRVCIHHDPSAC